MVLGLQVRSLFWLDSGHQLLSCGQDGAVYIWELEGSKRTGEFVQKGIMYTSAVAGDAPPIHLCRARA